MRTCLGLTVTLLMTIMAGPAFGRDPEATSKQFFLDEKGGGFEVRVNDPKNLRVRDAVREELKRAAKDQTALSSPQIRKHQKKITYRFEKTDRGGRVRVTAKDVDARLALQEFLRSQMTSTAVSAVNFTFIGETSLVVVPVSVNDHGPYHFLLDTGASNSILSPGVADSLKIPQGRSETLLSAGGNVPVQLRLLDALQVGDARLKMVEIAVANVPLLRTLRVDGILGGDYLRRFKISIDYDNQIVQIEPWTPDSMSMLIA